MSCCQLMRVEPKLLEYKSCSVTPANRKATLMCFGCKEWSYHPLLLIVMRCIPSKPVTYHFSCNGTWFSTMTSPPSHKDHWLFMWTPEVMKCFNSLVVRLTASLPSVCLQPWWGLMSEICAIYWGKSTCVFMWNRCVKPWSKHLIICTGCESWNCGAKPLNIR